MLLLLLLSFVHFCRNVPYQCLLGGPFSICYRLLCFPHISRIFSLDTVSHACISNSEYDSVHFVRMCHIVGRVYFVYSN